MNREKKLAYDSGYAPIGDLEMYYEIHGSGKMPLVLIHGGGSTIQTSFGSILPFLAAGRKVIAVELQGHGHTADRDQPESFEQDEDDVAAVLSYLKISKADFFGFSNGGNTAMQIAIRHPKNVNKLVLASSFYQRNGMIPGFFDGMNKATLDNMPGPLKTAYLEVAPDKSHLQSMHDKDKNRMIQFKDWSDNDLASIKAPALIINADNDVVLPEHAMKMAHVIPHARLMILPGSHGSFIGEVCAAKQGSRIPAATVAMVEEFLDE